MNTIYSMKQILNEWRKYLVEQDMSTDPSSGQTLVPAKDLRSGKDSVKELKKFIKGGNNFSYVLGTVDGEILAKHNENKLFYGASSNKPFLALFNLIKCSAPKSPEETPCECLKDDELRALLNYDTRDETGKRKSASHGGNSNVVNRALSNRYPSEKYTQSQKNYILQRRKQLCKPTGNKQATDFLAKLGFDTNMLVRYGPAQNKQSALGYFKLLSFLAKPEQYMKKLGSDLMQNQNFVNAANRVLRWMKREFSSGKDREHKGRFLKHLKDLQNLNLPVKSLYGKGGFAFRANNSAMIIDDKYIFVLFTNVKSKGVNNEKKYKILTAMSHVIADVLIDSGVYSKPPTSKKPVYQPM